MYDVSACLTRSMHVEDTYGSPTDAPKVVVRETELEFSILTSLPVPQMYL
jgi:hypothetical protein